MFRLNKWSPKSFVSYERNRKGKSGNTFEEALQKLERAVEKLDEGSLSLEEALSTFEDGVRWSRECHQFLEKAEERVGIILKNENGDYETKPFETEDN
ncbi:MAG: exodeoxyribonuclease VII small subunit [SAR324 cluster bacterium]|nr:exodeoxyribonuclease VII small subunit [SAR324 cluster bacterium]